MTAPDNLYSRAGEPQRHLVENVSFLFSLPPPPYSAVCSRRRRSLFTLEPLCSLRELSARISGLLLPERGTEEEGPGEPSEGMLLGVMAGTGGRGGMTAVNSRPAWAVESSRSALTRVRPCLKKQNKQQAKKKKETRGRKWRRSPLPSLCNRPWSQKGLH